ncbi:BBE domain-containing protein [Streptomyces sp. NPDC001817]|uniref:BBE domain-containing protein n=1 Tax=Streptomyces sp. NPDC001817 TaxID=3154398 RepID=UPI003319EB2D
MVQINHLGGALARPRPNAVPYREGRFLVRLLTVGERERARALLDPAFALPAGDALARSLDFAFGAGDRNAGLYDPETRKRLARVKETYDPANLFRRNYGVSA